MCVQKKLFNNSEKQTQNYPHHEAVFDNKKIESTEDG